MLAQSDPIKRLHTFHYNFGNLKTTPYQMKNWSMEWIKKITFRRTKWSFSWRTTETSTHHLKGLLKSSQSLKEQKIDVEFKLRLESHNQCYAHIIMFFIWSIQELLYYRTNYYQVSFNEMLILSKSYYRWGVFGDDLLDVCV